MDDDYKGPALALLSVIGFPLMVVLVLVCYADPALAVDSLDLSWSFEYAAGNWSKPGDGTSGALVERTGYSANLDLTGTSSGSISHLNTYYHYSGDKVNYTSQSTDYTKDTYSLDVKGPIISSKGYFNTVGWLSDAASRSMRFTCYATFNSPLDVKGSSLSWSLPGYVCALLEKNSNYYVSPVAGWSTYVKYWGGDWQYVSDSIDTSQKISGIGFTCVTTLVTGGQYVGGVYYLGLPVLPKLFVGDQVVSAIEQQTSDLTNTDGSADVATNVMTNFSQDAFNTKLGAVSQVVDMGDSLFKAVLSAKEGSGINFPGYSIDLPIYGNLSVPAQNIDVWGYFPQAETPVRTAVTFAFVMYWLHGLQRAYDRFLGRDSSDDDGIAPEDDE